MAGASRQIPILAAATPAAARRAGRVRASGRLGLASFVLLSAVAVFDGPLRICFAPSAVERTELGNAFNLYLLYPLALVFFVSTVVESGRAIVAAPGGWKRILVAACLPLSVTLSLVLRGDAYSRSSEIVRFGAAVSAFLVFRDPTLQPGTLRRALWSLFGLSVLLTGAIWVYFLSQNLITYSMSTELGIGRPQIAETLLQSTEMSNIAAQVLLLGLGVVATSRTATSALAALTLAIPVAYLFLIMGSVGSYIALALVLAIFGYRRTRIHPNPLVIPLFWCTVALLAAVALMADGRVIDAVRTLVDVGSAKVHTDGRTYLYAGLVDVIRDNPLAGIGYGQYFRLTGIYPHHNILGIWSELGFVCMAAYMIYLAVCLYWTVRLTFKQNPYGAGSTRVEMAYVVCLIMLFLHLKGLVHDTWMGTAFFLFTGALLGLTSSPRRRAWRRCIATGTDAA